jgi:hypothetical protein
MGCGNIMAIRNDRKDKLSNREMRTLINLIWDYDPGRQITPAGLAPFINRRIPHKRNRWLFFFKCKQSGVEHTFGPGVVIEGCDIREARRLEYYFGEIRKELHAGTKI